MGPALIHYDLSVAQHALQSGKSENPGHRHYKAKLGRYQGLANAGGHACARIAADGRDRVEGLNHAHDRSEQSEQRRNGGQRSENDKVTAQEA